MSPCNSSVPGWWVYGHFTQVVWADSTSVGCAVTTCSLDYAGEVIIACNFYPPGNYVDELEQNVLAPQGQAIIFDICAPSGD